MTVTVNVISDFSQSLNDIHFTMSLLEYLYKLTLMRIRILILALVSLCAKTEEVLVSQRARGGAGTTDVTDTARKSQGEEGLNIQRDHQQ